MVSKESVQEQLKRLGFKTNGWGRREVDELHNILMPDEEIHELANGIYEGGFALLVATDIRVFLVDKKPLNYLTVEDLRFDMINEIDYSHRLVGAQISIATGSKNLIFRSYNQQRLRKLIGHVQNCMAEVKRRQSTHQEGQVLHLENINKQLQEYLRAQQEYQIKLYEAQHSGKAHPKMPDPVKPPAELADFLYAQSLLEHHQQAGKPIASEAQPSAVQPEAAAASAPAIQPAQPEPAQATPAPAQPETAAASQPVADDPKPSPQLDDLYAEGMREIFGRHQPVAAEADDKQATDKTKSFLSDVNLQHLLEINPISIAYSKLPMAMRNRKFGRPSFHAHSAAIKDETPPIKQPAEAA